MNETDDPSAPPSAEPSAEPSAPQLCAIARECGGCGLIELPYAEQLADKHQRTLAALARYPELGAVQLADVLPAPEVVGYRTRAKLACSREGGGLRIGLYRPGSHDVIDTPDCPVLDPLVREVANAVRRVFTRAPFDALPLTYISVRSSRSVMRAHVTFVLSDDSPLADDAARALMVEAPSLLGVALNVNPGPPLRVFGPTFRHLVGEPALEERLAARAFHLGPGAFFQANVTQADAIVALVREHFGETHGRLVDFYGGAGTLGLNLAEPGAEVIIVEGYDAAAEDARRSAKENGFARVRVVPAPAERVARDLAEELGSADRVVVNPPRKGCAPSVLQALAILAPERAAYVSCDPTTLARDLAVLLRLGYEAEVVYPVDMLPQTEHVEAVALLVPRRMGEGRTPAVSVLYEDDALLVVDKPPFVPVHEGTGTLKTLLDLLAEERGDAARGYHLVHRLDAETSGVLVLAKDKETARTLSRLFDSRAVGKRYVCLVRGITRDKGVVNRALAGKKGEAAQDARTKYRSLLRLRGHTLCAVTPETGRLHQIRRHMLELDHPLIGDERYGDPATNRHFIERYAVGRLMLHAAAIAFPHPRTGVRVAISAPLPGDFAEVLARLGMDRAIDTAGLLRGLAEEEEGAASPAAPSDRGGQGPIMGGPARGDPGRSGGAPAGRSEAHGGERRPPPRSDALRSVPARPVPARPAAPKGLDVASFDGAKRTPVKAPSPRRPGPSAHRSPPAAKSGPSRPRRTK